MTDAELKAIRERAETATPGPWTNRRTHDQYEQPEIRRRGELVDTIATCQVPNSPNWKRDAAFIAHARQDVPALLGAEKELRGSNLLLLRVGIDLRGKLTAAETAAGYLRDALRTIQDYAGDTVYDLPVAFELLQDIGRVASKALKPEEPAVADKSESLWGGFDCPKCGAESPWRERQLKTKGHYLGLREVYCEGCGYISRGKDVGFAPRPPLPDQDGGTTCDQSP